MFQVMPEGTPASIMACLTDSALAPGFPVATIVTLVSPLQPSNALYSISVTLSGIVTFVRPLQ